MSFGNCEEEGHDERWGELKELDAAEIKDPTTKDFRVVAVFGEILVEVRLTKSSKKNPKYLVRLNIGRLEHKKVWLCSPKTLSLSVSGFRFDIFAVFSCVLHNV